jgi:hypothetical protein
MGRLVHELRHRPRRFRASSQALAVRLGMHGTGELDQEDEEVWTRHIWPQKLDTAVLVYRSPSWRWRDAEAAYVGDESKNIADVSLIGAPLVSNAERGSRKSSQPG